MSFNGNTDDLANEFAKQFNSTEGLITDRYDLQTNEQDYLQILQSIQHKDPELLYLPVDMQQLFKIQMALQKLDWHPEIMVSDGIFEDIKMQKSESLTMVDKVLFIDAFSHDMEFTPLGEQLLEQMAAMGMGLMDLGVSSALGMEGYVLLMQVMNDCIAQENQRDCINNGIRSTAKFRGIKGLISFHGTGKAHRSLSINRIKGDVTEFVVQVY